MAQPPIDLMGLGPGTQDGFALLGPMGQVKTQVFGMKTGNLTGLTRQFDDATLAGSTKMRSHTVLRVALCGLIMTSTWGCNRHSPSHDPNEEPPAARSVASTKDASVDELVEPDAADGLDPIGPSDPPAASGDIKAEIESFSSLDACVAARSKLDPIIGDAIEAIGYDTFVRDACRVLEAAKAKDNNLCQPIVSSSLREHCQTIVAVVTPEGLSCPMIAANHDPFCLAMARRDPRLCVHVPLERRRTCAAVIGRNTGACGGDKRCERAVERWKSLIPDLEPRQGLGSKITLEIVEVTEAGTKEPIQIDLSKLLQPATVIRNATGMRVRLGEQDVTPWPSARIALEPRMSLVMPATPDETKQGAHKVKLDGFSMVLLLPHVGTMRFIPTSPEPSIVVDVFKLEIGAPVRFVLDANVADGDRTFKAKLNVNTYVRDVVSIGLGSKAP